MTTSLFNIPDRQAFTDCQDSIDRALRLIDQLEIPVLRELVLKDMIEHAAKRRDASAATPLLKDEDFAAPHPHISSFRALRGYRSVRSV